MAKVIPKSNLSLLDIFIIVVSVLGLFVTLVTSTCPTDIPAEDIYPCFCFHDTNDLYCRGGPSSPSPGEGKTLDDQSLSKIFQTIRSHSKDLKFGKFALMQSDVTTISEKLFEGISFTDIIMRFNFKLRTIHPQAFAGSRGTLRNLTFGEVSFPYEMMQSPRSVDLAWMTGFPGLTNVFLSGINVGHLEESIFKPYVKGAKPPRFFLLGVMIDCGCKNKWIWSELDESQRSRLIGGIGSVFPFIGMEMALPMPMPSMAMGRAGRKKRSTMPYRPSFFPGIGMSCRSTKLNGVMIPLRSISIGEFKNC